MSTPRPARPTEAGGESIGTSAHSAMNRALQDALPTAPGVTSFAEVSAQEAARERLAAQRERLNDRTGAGLPPPWR
jgi:hypothetical protein